MTPLTVLWLIWLILCVAVHFGTHLVLVVLAFQRHVLWGLIVCLAPSGRIAFIATHWQRCRRVAPLFFISGALSLVGVFAGAMVAMAMNHASVRY